MTWPRAAAAMSAALAVAAALALTWPGEEDAGTRTLRIPGIGGSDTTIVVDSLGRPVRREGGHVGPIVSAGRGGEKSERPNHARALAEKAPRWARRMYSRSLLVLRALTYGNGAVIAGARDGWAYVWPRDAGAVALAYAAAGYRAEARRVARFLLGLDLDAAARFHPDGTPVPGREAQGDARGWVEVAAQAAGMGAPSGVSEVNPHYGGSNSLTPHRQPLSSPHRDRQWHDRGDYQEKSSGDYLGNAIANSLGTHRPGRTLGAFATGRPAVLVREAGDPASGTDSAAAWAVRPFPHPALFRPARRSLYRLLKERSGRFGIVPSEDWPEDDPWTAPTAWIAWAFAALARADASPVPFPSYLRKRNRGMSGDRRMALRLMGALRRAATPLGLLPERIDAQTGEPRSTTPLAWSHAFAILALRELWP